MNWWPDFSKIPLILKAILEIICKRIDDITPQGGQGTRVTDASGGGKVIDATGSGPGTILKNCIYFDSDAGEEGEGAFFSTDVYTNGRKKFIPPPDP